MSDEIMALCRAMGAGEGREELLEPMIRACCERLALRLRPDVLPADCGAAFLLAAAMLVTDQLAGMASGGTGGEVASFTAGDLTIRTQAAEGGRSGKSLTEQAEALLAPWVRDSGFVFLGVEG